MGTGAMDRQGGAGGTGGHRGKATARRRWWMLAGVVVLGLVLWAVYPMAGASGSGNDGTPAGAGSSAGDTTGAAGTGHDGQPGGEAAADYTIYPAGTGSEGQKALPEGQQLARYRVENGVKVFELTALPVKWSVGDKEYEAWTFNGTVPGPQIRVKEGDRVRIIVKNQLPEPTVVHWHGLAVPNKMDGVPMVTQDPIPPGGQFVYEFVAQPAGTHMYHTHHNTMKQKGMGLYGTFIVEPKDPEPWKYDADYSLMISDGQLGYVINGKSFPHTARAHQDEGGRDGPRPVDQHRRPGPPHAPARCGLHHHRQGRPAPAPTHEGQHPGHDAGRHL
ncbi:putative multicopper oxidase [Thermaerobacter subterraneus DSM 13965]|uniref:Multicopper oxidase n=1 Tax=Thermaerobacter subterraneus DSM 13965 TaxID=867903 RepID=K6QF52_9FIRM|nr:putative multicopper oxidase [Thermaerobacter subterraneus DSM 13965]